MSSTPLISPRSPPHLNLRRRLMLGSIHSLHRVQPEVATGTLLAFNSVRVIRAAILDSAQLIQGTRFVIPTTHTLLAAPGVTQRASEYFPEPYLWEPHRWDEKPSEKYARLSPLQSKEDEDEETEDYGYGLVSKGAASPYLPFGAGRHRCIGEQFAYVQLQTILATLIRDIKFFNIKGKEGELVGTDYSSLFSRPLQPAVVRWERREKS